MTKVSGDDSIGRAAIGIVPEELTEENYQEWKRCLEHYLVGHGLWGVVSGEEKDPINDERQEYGEEKNQEHEEWKKKNALALHAIQLSCGPGTYVKLKEAHTSAEVAWKHLVERLKPHRIWAEGDPEDESSRVEEEDVASMLLQQYPKLGVTPDKNGYYALQLLAHKPSAFPSGTKLVFWKRWIHSCLMGHSLWRSLTDSAKDDQTTKASMIGDHSIEIHHSSDGETNLTGNRGLQITSFVLKVLHGLGWSILSCLGLCHDRKVIHKDANELLTLIFKEIETLSMKDLEEMDIMKILYDAIEQGIIEFVDKIFKYRTGIIYKRDEKGRTIFSHAIVLRQDKIYSLLNALGTRKSILARRHDFFGNNLLHLAAKLSPLSRLDKISGAALQMQREIRWFKEVESIVQPRMKEERNAYNKTPSELFTEEHKVLAKEGERWMKNTAGSSMIVGTLIAAVMFTTAFTVPGGNDNKTGLPVMLETQQKAFLIFMASNALSMFTSSTSILMFLGILTARYAEGDFLKSLPTKLIFGITCLFVSIVTMMASFGTALYLMLIKQVAWISYPIIVFSVVPIALYSLLQFPLLVEMISRTYGHGIFEKPKKKLYSFETDTTTGI
ncbi:uncharacterized protein [Coffea arabica]|uniref:Uncharacterized protein isoform X3 n=1 Tax=Coffea arabica TaxID=13443 RepID=A0A6P6TC05_COFAR